MRLALAALLLALATPARAEWTADVYGGAAYSPRSDFAFVIAVPGGADHTFHDVKWSTSPVLGARGGYWLDGAPWFGVGLDLFRFRADIPDQDVQTTIFGATLPATLRSIDISITAVAFDVLRLRYLRDGSVLRPYFNAGPALFHTRAQNRGNGELTSRPATDTSWGYALGAGLSWQLGRRTALFGEYRYTRFRSEPVFEGGITGQAVPMRLDLATHHLLAGVSLQF